MDELFLSAKNGQLASIAKAIKHYRLKFKKKLRRFIFKRLEVESIFLKKRKGQAI